MATPQTNKTVQLLYGWRLDRFLTFEEMTYCLVSESVPPFA